MTRELIELARSKDLSKSVGEILEKRAKAMRGLTNTGLLYIETPFLGRPRLSRLWRIDRLESTNATFGKVTDITSFTLRRLIESGQIDARISIDTMEVIFALEDLISDGIMSLEESDEIIKEARQVITTEQLLYRMKKEELVEAFNKYVKKIEAKDMPSERKEKLINHGGYYRFIVRR